MQQPTPGGVPSAAMQGGGGIPSVGLQQPNQQGTVPSQDLQQQHKPQQVTPDAHLSPPEAALATPPPGMQRPSIPVPPQKKLGKLPSLKDIQTHPSAAVETAVAEEEEDSNYGAVMPLDVARLKTIWHAILRRKKAENMMEYTLLNRQYHIGEDNEIILHLENHVMMDQFTSLRPEVLRELKKETGNRSIKLKAEVMEVQDDKKLYTSQDKFNYLAEKYPVIVDMKQRLGLDTDF
jgi:DNA polymerase III subunit gamma/tau